MFERRMRPPNFGKFMIGRADFVYNFGIAGSLRRRVGSAFIMRKGHFIILICTTLRVILKSL